MSRSAVIRARHRRVMPVSQTRTGCSSQQVVAENRMYRSCNEHTEPRRGGISVATAVRPWTAHRDEFKSPGGAESRLPFNFPVAVVRHPGWRIVLDEFASAVFENSDSLNRRMSAQCSAEHHRQTSLHGGRDAAPPGLGVIVTTIRDPKASRPGLFRCRASGPQRQPAQRPSETVH